MPYTPTVWEDSPDTDTPITAARLNNMESGIDTATDDVATVTSGLAAHLADSSDAHDASAISLLDAANDFAATDVEGALAEIQTDIEALSAAGSGEATAVTALPGSPADGDEIIFMDSLSAPTFAWRFRYISAKSSNKWQFIGGSPRVSEVATSENSAATAYGALSTAGPAVAVPVAGDYIVEHGCAVLGGSTNLTGTMSYDIGASGATDADGIEARNVASDPGVSISRMKAKAGLTAVTLTAKYKVSTGNANFKDRWLRITPVAIGG